MKKTARIIYLLIGIVFPILIGALHTLTHFTQLVSKEVQGHLSPTILINGVEQTLWNTWGMMSFMMGVAFIIIGLLNLSIYRSLTREALPPVSAILAMMLYLLCVIYAGHQFEQSPQFFGGLFGFGLSSICLWIIVKEKTPERLAK